MIVLACATTVLTAAPAWGHEKWFVEPARYPLLIDGAAWTRTLWAGVATAAALLLALLIDRAWRRHGAPLMRLAPPDVDRRRLFAWIPFILALHVAVPLAVAGIQRQLFVPNLELPRTVFGGILALLEIMIALAFVYGALARPAAAALALLFPVGTAIFGIVDIADVLHLLGIAGFLMVFGRGPHSLDAIFRTPRPPLRRIAPAAIPVLRVLTGLSIAWVGFSEKLWNLPMALAFLRAHPLNFMPAAGFPGFSDAHFAVAAGVIEVAMGVVLASGFATRPVILTAWVPFNLSLPFLGWIELIGHLPIYGIMAVLLLWGSGRDVRPFVEELAAQPG